MSAAALPNGARLHAQHHLVTTLTDLDTLDEDEIMAGHLSAQRGDPEPGGNHTRAFHHGWRTRMMDLGEIPPTPEHDVLARAWADRERRERRAAVGRRPVTAQMQKVPHG